MIYFFKSKVIKNIKNIKKHIERKSIIKVFKIGNIMASQLFSEKLSFSYWTGAGLICIGIIIIAK